MKKQQPPTQPPLIQSMTDDDFPILLPYGDEIYEDDSPQRRPTTAKTAPKQRKVREALGKLR